MSELLIDLEKPIGYLASLLIFFGQLTYFKDVWQKKIAPSILTWFGWALLMATLIVVQVLSTGWDWSLMSITSCTFGCFAIGIVSLVQKSYQLLAQDWWFLGLGLFCGILYVLSKDPWLTTFFAVISDFIIGFPTIVKAYKEPKKEKTRAWIISLSCWSITSLISFNHNLLYAVFPVYICLYSAYICFLIYLRNPKLDQ